MTTPTNRPASATVSAASTGTVSADDGEADRVMLADAVATILDDLCTPADVTDSEAAGWSPRLWSALAEAGMPWISVPESAGGSGGDLGDACTMLTVAGRYAVPLPLAETGILAGWAMAAAGLAVPSGPLSAAPADALRAQATPDGWRLHGRLDRVPWAGQCDRVVTVLDTADGCVVVAVAPGSGRLTPGRNLAGEPRNTLTFHDTPLAPGEVGAAPPGVTPDTFRLRGALGRAALMAGALSRVRELTVRYTNQRTQFGRPVARFQAVAQHLVRTAEEAVLVDLAVRIAADADDGAGPGLLAGATAKILAGQAATTVTAAAHQAHGAIGMTREYELGALTRRLWSWRDEWRNETYWSRRLGAQLSRSGADALWPALATPARQVAGSRATPAGASAEGGRPVGAELPR